ncbi:hypothetical protein [Paenibacillus sp. B2(2019)]|uniref:hypothetical protein n=1 Tax=Paenibacillus sp. B2(2019) TaxID=2607754 RepID=UPI0011F317EE|nr:hypothetical protein [Paenibacillus sp. B2(2019)]KAA1180939.1 hypothetical protein PAENI_27300 [Paenibacillus sp. B2(2019)]
MTKLEGNERWKTKMIMTEHVEQYEEQDDFISYYKIFFRGYQERFGMTRDVMRAEISLQLTKYTSDLGTLLKESQQ